MDLGRRRLPTTLSLAYGLGKAGQQVRGRRRLSNLLSRDQLFQVVGLGAIEWTPGHKQISGQEPIQ